MVHRFLVRGTVEERMHSTVNSEAENWDGRRVTLRQLQDLFTHPNEESNRISSEAASSSTSNVNHPGTSTSNDERSIPEVHISDDSISSVSSDSVIVLS